MASGNISVAKGEVVPLAVRVVPASVDYKDFTIDKNDDTYVVVMNSLSVPILQSTDVSIDQENKTVLFPWDTKDLDTGAYTIVFWISVTYNNTTFKMKSNTISKSIKKASLIE